MKTHTNAFKENIKELGRQLDSIITYTMNNEEIELGGEELNSITPHYEGSILKSVMKQLDIDSNVEIPVGQVINYQFGVYDEANEQYDYIDFGNYVVKEVEKQEDTSSYLIKCYDKMLYTMVAYETPKINNTPITYPITIRDYLNAICEHLGLTFKNASDTFANYDKEIQNELFIATDGTDMGYTFRDVLDQIAGATASTICINENDDELEIRYINDTEDEIDEEYLKDINVKFGEQFGAINTIVLSRSGDSDSIYYPSVLPENPVELKIQDNEIMNFNDRDEYLPDIYDELNGLEYHTNDFSSPGIAYYDLCDRYNVVVGENTYSCVMFNDELVVTQGLEENIHTDLPEESVTEYEHADTTDRKVNKTYIIAKKNEGEIEELVSVTENNTQTIEQLITNVDGLTNNLTQNGGNNLFYNTGLWFTDENGNFTYWTVESSIAYFQTTDEQYIEGKEYYNLVNDNYVLLIEGTDYNIGDTITGTIYEKKQDGYMSVINDAESLSGTNMVLPWGKVRQTINVTPGTHSCSFYYRQNIVTANCYVTLNGKRIQLDNETEWTQFDTEEQQIEITGNTLTIEFECDVQGGFYVKELMLNRGTEVMEYSQNINETRTDTVQISDGIVVSSTSTRTRSRIDSDGFRVINSNDEIVLRATENGTETKSINVSNDSEIAGLIIKKYDGHVLLSSKGGN